MKTKFTISSSPRFSFIESHAGGSALLYSIPVSVSASRITLTVPAALAAQIRAAVVLPGATWNCSTLWNNTGTALFPIGSQAIHGIDEIGRQPWPQ